MIEIRMLTIETKPRGKTIILEGEIKKEKKGFILVSRKGKVQFLDIDNYLSFTVELEVSTKYQELVGWAGAPLIKGNFSVKSIELGIINREDSENGKW